MDQGIEEVIMKEKVAGCQYSVEFCLENGNSGASQKVRSLMILLLWLMTKPDPAILFLTEPSV